MPVTPPLRNRSTKPDARVGRGRAPKAEHTVPIRLTNKLVAAVDDLIEEDGLRISRNTFFYEAFLWKLEQLEGQRRPAKPAPEELHIKPEHVQTLRLPMEVTNRMDALPGQQSRNTFMNQAIRDYVNHLTSASRPSLASRASARHVR